MSQEHHQQVIGDIGSYNNNFSNNTGSHNNFNSFNNIVNFITRLDNEGRQILQWLSPLEPQQRHQGVRTDRLDGVGNWVLETSEFRKWRDGEDGCVEQVLLCYGGPGVGKTYVSSLVIDSLCNQVTGKDVAVVGLYCDFHAQQEQTTTNMLGAMLKQLASRGISENIREAYEKAQNEFGGRGLQLPEMLNALKKTIASLPRLFICIDALDECTPKHRRELIKSLREIARVLPGARIFITGRPHIDDEITTCFSKALRIPLSPTHGDITSYLERRLDNDTEPKAMDAALRADIMRIIPEKISEIFLLVSLYMDAILDGTTLSRRRNKLDEITKGKGLGDAYTGTLSRIQAQSGTRSKLGMEVLMWVSHAERPLRVDELCHALGVEGSTDLDTGNIPPIETLLACSLGLVMVEKSSCTVRLVHYTLQEYLFNNTNLFPNPHSIIAEVCLTYLNFPHVRSLSPALSSVPPTSPFIEYASCYWGAHAGSEATESVKTLALKLLDGYDKHISSKVLLLHGVRAEEQPFDGDGVPTGFTGLHGAAYLGCQDIVAALLETNSGWATDIHGNVAIAWASKRGHEGVVRVLLERSGINSDTKFASMALLWAAEDGHEGVVRMLLERDEVNPDKPDIYGRTPLSWASGSGQEGVARILLERSDVNPDKPDRHGRTPLFFASGSGHEGVVRMLLERNDVNPDKPYDTGLTPLALASGCDHEGVVRILLGRNDVNPDKEDRSGYTPLLLASTCGNEGVVRMLLNRNDVNPDKQNKYCQTPLLAASINGHEGVVRILLERDGLNPDKPDKDGKTPLMCASLGGHEGVVRMLLERNDVNPNNPDEVGSTALLCASFKGHDAVVRTLLEREDINPDIPSKYGYTPLLIASEGGHEGTVRILLERNVNPDTPSHPRKTPLSVASRNGHEGIVRMLLELNDVNPDKQDPLGRTPLSFACGGGHEGVVRMLLERNDVNPDQRDLFRRTPLSLARRNKHEGVVKMLLEQNDTDPHKQHGWRRTLRWWTSPGPADSQDPQSQPGE